MKRERPGSYLEEGIDSKEGLLGFFLTAFSVSLALGKEPVQGE